ncbi:TPM domain-containing protein [Mariniblastus fucicola]|uniref:TPM domain-containing protein n=1 Tax=Mariniblastus fucicola TaxID=980251 RepID=UPI0012FA7F86|nr:TPM domain-containing protein [Mariniblastus fucicola]
MALTFSFAFVLPLSSVSAQENRGVEFRVDGSKSSKSQTPTNQQNARPASARPVGKITPYNIPTPRPEGWVVDLTNTLNAEEKNHINEVCEEVFQTVGREMTVVVIDTTNGVHHRTFGMNLFNHWQVGSAFRNNGILVMAAIKDRQAEIVLGKGIDTTEQERVAQQIMDNVIVPNFQRNDPGSALYEGIRACAARILLVSDIKAPPELPSAAEKRAQQRKYQRRRSLIPWFLGALGVGGLGLVIGGRYWIRYRPRICEVCNDRRVLLDEVKDDEFLDPPERLEERIGSVDYDVWACLTCEEVIKIRYGKFWTRYSFCPKCGYATRSKITRTLIHATTSHGGKVLVEEKCANCDYYDRHTYYTPRVVKSSSSSSSGFGGGSSGGGFSGGFGGGSSSGGGASGSW